MFGRRLSSDLFRISKMKSVIVILVVMLVGTMLSCLLLTRLNIEGILGISRSDFDTMYEEQDDDYASAIDTGFQMGFEVGVNAAEEDQTEIPLFSKGIYYDIDVPTMFQANIADSTNLIVLALFTAMFIGSEFSTSYIKNFVNVNKRRGVWFASKLTSLAIVTLAYELVIFIYSTIGCALFSEKLRMNIDRSAILYFFIVWLLLFAFVSLVSGITIMTKSMGAGITVGVILGAQLLTLIFSIIDLIIGAKFDVPADFKISNYTITSNIATLTMNADGSVVLRAIIVALVYGVIANVVTWMIHRKRDIV